MSRVWALRYWSPVALAADGRRKRDKKKTTKKARSQLVPGTTAGGKGFRVTSSTEEELVWKCVEGCGACCKLDKGPAFPTPEEIFSNPSDTELYKSLIGPDGWCIHYEKTTRKCSIYPDRPYFCRAEPDIFHSLYGINQKFFNREACNSCRDTINEIYGPNSKELDKFNTNLRSSDSS